MFKWRFKVQEEEVYLSSHKGMIHELSWREHCYEKLMKPLKVETFKELSQGDIDVTLWFKVLGA